MARRKSVPKPASFVRPEGRAPIASKSAASRAYPTVREALASPDSAALMRGAVHAASILSAIALVGCAQPECETSSLGEARVHTVSAMERLLSLEPVEASKELGVGMGIVAHPSVAAIAGAMPAIYVPPTPPVILPSPQERAAAGEMVQVRPTAPVPETGTKVEPSANPADPLAGMNGL